MLPIVAILIDDEVQEPPLTVLNAELVVPVHIMPGPVSTPATGNGSTVTIRVAVHVPAIV